MNAVIFFFFACALYVVISTGAYGETQAKLMQKQWFAGSIHCEIDSHSAMEVFAFNANTFIIRQSKCLHYEAPFIYLLLGDHKALLLDTGATASAKQFPLARTVQTIIAQHLICIKRQPKAYKLHALHSHSHSDHIAADLQFSGLEGVSVVPPHQLTVLQKTLQLSDWPNSISVFELGGRNISVIPTPGHQREAISLYDDQTQWLLTGDTFYPGRLYIRDWLTFKNSIARLVEFSEMNSISAILGTHIEMSVSAKKDYPSGSVHHPNEVSLVLTTKDLQLLHRQLIIMGLQPEKVRMDKFIISPLK
ncbi:MBL fold metallo-hydrolase [Pseudoalteromonas citrea]|uniref:MBL fold metallo-hydrolase n=1 Tax=Pseudoalteromonas citrea TaxID=43655 RepID=A0A5S3XG59_9GAMM|nr:MBL fold metallo-hydrolase [Pseudoalteromonas citrea]TMP37856.1 MBL fold metallo-hydrolase [Pseudoalteromonas citrea]TMP52389.1 MBL fold metallo-hydrolase [Pseudoalteromonas citrea]